MAHWRKLGARVGCDERDYKLGEAVDISRAPAEAEEGDGNRVVAEDATPEAGDVDVSQAQAQAPDETLANDKVSGGGEMEVDRGLEGIAV